MERIGRLIFGMVPFWARLRHVQWFKSALNGVYATAIDLDGAACVILSEGAVVTAADAMFVVLVGGVFGAILHEDALSFGQVEWCTLAEEGGMITIHTAGVTATDVTIINVTINVIIIIKKR
eukprot:scaffold22700_cov52-Cyclotella_meneghiniana.AAC.8